MVFLHFDSSLKPSPLHAEKWINVALLGAEDIVGNTTREQKD